MDEQPTRGSKDLTWVGSSYFAEGLPWSVLHQIAGEFLTAVGMRPAQVGYTSLLHAATSLKFLWSPIVDLFGSLRQWMIAMQALLGIAVGALALLAHGIATSANPADADPTWIWITLVVIGVLSATHDIGCDGYYMDALDKRRQASYSGARTAAFRFAMLVGSSGLVFLGGRYSWLLGFGAGAGIMLALAIGHRLFLPHGESEATTPPEARTEAEPDTEPDTEEHPKGWAHIKTAYLSFLRQDRALYVIAFFVFYKLADSLMFGMSKVLLDRELGVPTDLRGILNSFSIGAAMLGAIVGGAWIGRKSLAKTLLVITLLMAFTEPLYVMLATFAEELAVSVPGTAKTMADVDMGTAWWRLGTIGLVIVTEQFCGGLATVAQMIFIMRRCHPDHKAAHYAFATAVYSTAQMLTGGYSGHAYEMVGPVGYFWITTLLTLPAIALVRFVPKD